MSLEIHERPDTVPSPEIDVGAPSPDIKSMYSRQLSDSEYSPYDTPRKNKRKLSEPKRRTTDFSIKRLCPDSPGSACSESGCSEESTPERTSEDLRDSPNSETSPGIPCDKDTLHPHLRPPVVFSDMRNHPYFIPQFYYNRFPGYPGSEHLPMFSGYPGMPSVPVQPPSHPASVERSGPAPPAPKKRNSQNSHNKNTNSDLSRAARDTTSATSPEIEWRVVKEEDNNSSDEGGKDSKKCRKNYKNMTRERRVEANARERSRVHTISAAFEGLRRAVPSYSYNQKLSKLAILRIACSYINALTKLTDSDDCSSSSSSSSSSPDVQNRSFADCVDMCTRTIQTEGKARRRH